MVANAGASVMTPLLDSMLQRYDPWYRNKQETYAYGISIAPGVGKNLQCQFDGGIPLLSRSRQKHDRTRNQRSNCWCLLHIGEKKWLFSIFIWVCILMAVFLLQVWRFLDHMVQASSLSERWRKLLHASGPSMESGWMVMLLDQQILQCVC